MTPLAAAAPGSGGGLSTILLLALPFAVLLYLMFTQRKRARAVTQAQAGLEVGQEVMAAAGIYGTITALDDGVVHLEVAPGVVVRVARRAIVPDVKRPAGGAQPGESA
jgi:preprotein translocase subunit YajC